MFDWISDRHIKLALLYPAEVLVLLATLALLIGVRPRWWWTVPAGALAILAIIVRTARWYPEGFDLNIFWNVGRMVWDGKDPYPLEVRLLNPPTALPLHATLGSLAFDQTLLVFTIVNVIGCIALTPLGWKALSAQDASLDWRLPWHAVLALTGVVAFCYACRRGLDAGQLSVLITLPLFAALWAQGRGWWWLAGPLLAVASVKAGTLLPFLLLFLHKSDWKTWAAMAVAGLALCLAATPPLELVSRCRECLTNIGTLSQPGRVNDFDPINSQTIDLILLDHALYHSGLRDRAMIRMVSLGLTAAFGLWLAWQVIAQRVPRAAACALAAFYAGLFLYHRQYDMVVLALPLVYVTGRAQHATGPARWLYAASGLAILAVLYILLDPLEAIRVRIVAGEATYVEQAVLYPYATWSTIAGLLLLATAEKVTAMARNGKAPP